MQNSPSREIAEVVHAVNAEAERTGALILAEGIETEDHLRRALALGASYGQGWLFGRPGELRADRDPAGGDLPAAPQRREDGAERAHPVRDRRRQAAAAPRRQAPAARAEPLDRAPDRQPGPRRGGDLSTFQEASHFTPETARRYAGLAEDAALVAALGVGMDAEPAPGVRGVRLDADEALRGEWNVTVLGPHFGAAFVARDLGDTGPDRERRFDFALTHDRELVTEVARSMMRRLLPPEAGVGRRLDACPRVARLARSTHSECDSTLVSAYRRPCEAGPRPPPGDCRLRQCAPGGRRALRGRAPRRR